MLKKTYSILRSFTKEMKRKHISSFAAGTAFFLFVSLVPMLIVICSVLPYTPIKEESMILTLLSLVPEVFKPLIKIIIADIYESNAGLFSLALLVTLWSAGKGVLGLMNGLNEIGEVEEKRNYFFVRLIASFYTLIMLLMLVFALTVMVFGNVLVEMIVTKAPHIKYVLDFFMHFRVVAFCGLLTLFFATIYAYVPNQKFSFKMQIPGAAVSAVAWSVFSWVFSLYVKNNSFGTYGSLSLIVFVLLWLYFGIYIILIGAHINKYFGFIYHRIRYSS